MQSKTKITKQKFYKKWLYKISLRQQGVAALRVKTLQEVYDFCNGPEPDNVPHWTLMHKVWQGRENLGRLAEFLIKNSKHEWSKRIESSTIDFYTNDKKFYDKMSKEFYDIMVHRFEPDKSVIDLLDNEKNIIVKKLPHNIYQYRVYLLPHKLAGDTESKQAFLSWLKGQHPRVTCTPSIENWFMNTDWNWDRRYVLVDNEQTLLMLKLRNSEVVGRIYNFVVA